MKPQETIARMTVIKAELEKLSDEYHSLAKSLNLNGTIVPPSLDKSEVHGWDASTC